MELDKLIITEQTKINEILKYLDIDLETFFLEFISESIDRTNFWRKFENDKIHLCKK